MSLPNPTPSLATKKQLVAIVDDEQGVQATLTSILERRGYAVVSAYTAKECLQVLQAHAVDLILMDLGLPDCKGLDLLRAVRKAYPKIPVVVVTANDSPGNITGSTKLGAHSFISKPFVPNRLLEHVAKALQKAVLVDLSERD